MRNKQKSILKFIIIISILFIFIAFLYEIYKNYSVNKETFNIGNFENYSKDIRANGVVIFDEYILEEFKNIETEIDKNNKEIKLYRTNENIEGLNSENKIIKNSLLKLASSNENNNFNKEKFFEFKNNLLNDKFNNNYLNYFFNINKKNNIYIENIINSNKTFSFNQSGYLVTYNDGYENLININNIDKIDPKNIIDTFQNKSSHISGMKYVNNRIFYIITYIKNIKSIDKSLIHNINLEINNKKYNFDFYKFIPYEDGAILVFSSTDGILDFIENRFVKNINIKNKVFKSFKIPNRAIIEQNGLKGILYIDKSIIKFTPIKILETNNDESIVTNTMDNIFPNILEESNILFEEIKPFTNIILNPSDFKIGQRF